MEPKLEFSFSCMELSVILMISGFLSFSRIRIVARSIQSRNSFLLMEILVS